MNRTTILVLTTLPLLVGCPGSAPAPQPAAPKPTATAAPDPAALRDPSRATAKAPETFKVSFETSKGPFVIEVTRAWAPHGADRFYNLARIGYFDGVRFFRVLRGFMAQFGIHGDPQVNAAWQTARIPDDPVTQSNTFGMVTFATAGPNTRTTQVFINTANNTNLDGSGFAPFGKVVSGMETVKKLFNRYGEGAPRGPGPDQGRLQAEGNAYLQQRYPKLDFVKRATIVP